MNKMLLVTSDFAPLPGGVARYYGALQQAIPEISVLTSVPGEVSPRVYRCAWAWWLWPHWLPLLWLLPQYKRQAKAELLAAGQVLPLGTVLWLFKLLCGWQYVVFLHGLDITLTQKTGWKRWLARNILSAAHLVVANSEFTKSLVVAAGSNPLRTVVVYPSLSLSEQQPELVEKLKQDFRLTGKLVLLSVARLVSRKGIAQVLSMLPELRKQFPNLVYVVVGDGPERSLLEATAHSANLPALFTGAVSDDYLSAWYSLCDVFILTPASDPVDVEGFGIVYLEAQAAGKPVIGSSVGGVPEAVGEAGILISSSQELAAAVRALLTDQNLRQSLGAKGSARVRQGFTPQAQAATLRHYVT